MISRLCALLAVLCCCASAHAVIMDFDSQPVGPLAPPNAPYIEDGYTLVSTTGSKVVDLLNSGNHLVEPMSGGTLFTFTEATNLPFGIFTLDYAGGPTGGGQAQVTGNKFGGGTVTSTINFTGNPASSLLLLNWMPNNGITLTSMTVFFPGGVTGATDTYEFVTVVPEPTAAGAIALIGLALSRRPGKRRERG
jgi:hypothetical protein